MTICTKNCSCKSSSGYCQLTACIYPDTMTVIYDEPARKLKPDGSYERVYVITESDLESSIRASLKEIYKDGYYQDITFNLFSRLMKNHFEKSSKYF